MNNPIRILLVDDSPYFLEAARDFLQFHESLTVVDTATEGQDALAKSLEGDPDVILLDLNLAHRSGLDLIPLFRERLPEVKIIVLTMMEETSYRAAALQAGADAFVSKSAMSKTLVSAILEAMERADTSIVNPNDNQLAGQEVHGDARFRSLFEQSNDAVFVIDLQGNHVMANRRAAEMLSYTLEEVQHLSFKDISAEVQKSEQVLKRLLTGEHIPVFERKFRKKNGEIFPVEINAEVVRDSAGKPLHIQSVVRDITERRRAEEALRDREAELSGLIESTMDAIIVVDEQQHILLFNPAAEQLFKSPASKAIGSSLTRFIPQAVREKHQDHVRAFGSSDQSRRSMQTPTLELNCLRADGEMFASEISISKFETKGHKRFIAFIRDITGRKRAEIEIQRRNEDLSLLDAVNQALNRGESLSVVVALVSNGLKKSYDGFGATIYLLDSSRQRLVNQNMALPPDLLKKIEKLVGVAIPHVELDLQRDHPFRRVFETRQIEVLNDPRAVRDHYVAFAEAVPLRPAARAVAKKAMPVIQQLVRAEAEMLVPLVSNDVVIGVMDLSGRAPFTEKDVKRMESIAGQLTVAIQRKWAEETLRAVEEKYRHIFENAVEAITQTTPAGLYITANQAAARMLGYNSPEELIASVTELDRQFYVEPDRREEFKSLMEKQGVVTGFESEIRRRDGTTMWISENSQAVRDQTGTLVCYEGSAVDITERKRAEMALRRSLEQTSRAQHTLQALNRAAQAAQRAHTPQAIYQAVGKEMKELGFDLVIYDFDAAKQDLSVAFIPYAEGIVRAAEALTGLSASTYRFPVVPGGFYERALSAGKAIFYDDLKSIVAESLPQPMSPLARPLGRILGATRGIYAVLKVDGKPRNILMVLGSDLGEEDLPAVDALASQISIALENARLYEDTLNTAERRAVLYDAGQEIVRVTQNAEELYAAIHRAVSKLIPTEAFTIVLHNENRDDLEGVYLFDKGGRWDSKRIPFGQGFSSRVISSNETILIRDLEQTSLDAVHFGTDDPIRSVLAVPLRNSNKVIGAISAQSYQPEAYTEEDRYHLEMLASQASIGLENARLFDKLQRELNERKQTEKALREKTDELDRYFTSSLDLLCIADTDGYFRRLNPEWENILGYPLADLEGQRFLDFVHPDDLPSTLTALSQLSGNKEVLNFENRYRCKDGSYRWIEWRSYPHDKLIYAVARDITQRKHADEKIQRQVEYLNALRDIDEAIASSLDMQTSLDRLIGHTINLLRVDASAVLLVNLDEGTLEFAAGSGFRSEFVRSASIKLGESYAGRAALEQHMVQIPNLADKLDNLFLTGFLEEEHFTSYYGTPLTVKGKVIGVLEVFHRSVIERDTEWLDFFHTLAGQAAIAIDHSRLIGNLQRSNVELEQRVQDRTADLNRTNIELERSLRVKDEFLANMSHELRTPLNAILGLSESLGEQTAGELNAKQQKYVHTINESGHHLLELINDILDLAKIEAGQLTLDRARVDINSLCQASLRMIKQLALKKNLEVILQVDDQLDLIWADERRLKQMIVNLLSNAVKFTPRDGKIGLELHGSRNENKVVITVWDNGIGIQEEDLARLFRPFVQLDSDLAREATGTGLGLALVAQMARLHGGSVQATSQFGAGSRFTILLPWESALASDTLSRMKITGKFRAVKPGEKRQTILFVEDTEEVIMMLSDYLEYTGYKVEIAKNGMEGIARAKQIHPDLILMDVQMPELDGLETTRRLRSEEDLRNTPIIALTALAMKGDRERCLAAGMDEYISKPVNLKALLKMIHTFLP